MTDDTPFTLDERLLAGSLRVASWPLCEVLLKDEARHLWVLLVPRRAGVRELFELTLEDRGQLMHESCTLGAAMMQMTRADKLNVAAIGNVVSQLHVHHVARSTSDADWPAPFFGAAPPRPRSPEDLQALAERLRAIPVS